MKEADLVAHYIGRNIIDLPADFRLAGPSLATFVPVFAGEVGAEIEITIVDVDMPHSQFLGAVDDRRKLLAKAGGSGEDVLVAAVKQSENSVLFRVIEVGDSYLSEMDVYIGGSYLRVVGHSYHGKFSAVESSMARFIERIGSASEKNDANAFHFGPLSISGRNTQERADFLFRSAKRPDVLISIAIDTYGPDEKKALLSRMAGNSLLATFDVKHRVLRKRELTVSGMRAQEWLGVARLEDDDNYGFAFETMRQTPGPDKPMLHIELDSGQYDINRNKQPNSLTVRTALDLWDTIIKSIRRQNDVS